MEVKWHNFLHTVFDHLRSEEVGLSLFVDCDLSEVLQQNGTDGFGGVGHVDGPVVTHHLAHVGKSTAVIQMEMTERNIKEEKKSQWNSHNRQMIQIKYKLTL